MQLFGWAVPLRRHNIPGCARSVRLHTMHRQRIITYVERAIIEGPRLTVSVAKRLGDRACNVPVHQGRPEVEAATLVPLILASVFFFNRMAAKSMGLAVIQVGFGKNMWDVIPMDNITEVNKVGGRLSLSPTASALTYHSQRFFAFVVLYKTQISLAKISVCLFLLRIFQTLAFRYTTYAIIGLNAAIGVTWVLVDSLRCNPVHLAWDGWTGETPGTCINFTSATFANAFVNIAVDTVMVLMPVYEISKLNLSGRKKLGVSVMFAMGLVLTVVAILRVVVFYLNRWGKNPTVELQPIVHWSVIEVSIAVLCACLPTGRAMLAHFFPGLLGGSADKSYPQPTTPSARALGPSRQGQRSQIAKTVSYSVDYQTKPQKRDSNSFVRLVELDPLKEGSVH
ncbi:integral membrane protein [Aspergillus fumigatus A1163]|uniref:Integral membrane protein n=1 Tax=Aspergillus fumigatus (strain CBS 144.89 / FGSC A1163 / CEA10) TaxID=451804 RepID=B0Y1B1_ASPFC|nr:integral membrane protein [Aspergillus fumigatus A1163]